VVTGAKGEHAPVQAFEEASEAAAIGDDGVAEFVPECPVELAGRDAEVMADIGDDGADGAATHHRVESGGKPCGDLFLCGQACEARVLREARRLGVVGGLEFRLGVWRCDLAWGAGRAGGGQADGGWLEVLAAGGATDERGFEGRGATQATGDAGEDDSEVGGAEGFGEEGEAGVVARS
jgi:hypothetical protein